MGRNDPSKVASAVVDPPGAVKQPLDQDFVLRRVLDEARIREVNQRSLDKIGAYLGTQMYRTDMTWPFLLVSPGYQLRVSKWYPTVRVAVDTFRMQELGPLEAREVAFKRQAFKANGIKYAALTLKDGLASITAQTGLVVPEGQ